MAGCKIILLLLQRKKKKTKVTKLTSTHSDARCLFLCLCIQIEQFQSLILYTIERRSVTTKFEKFQKFLRNQTRELSVFLLWVSPSFGFPLSLGVFLLWDIQFTFYDVSSLWTWPLSCPPGFRIQAPLLSPYPSSDSHLHLRFCLITWYLAVFPPKSLL